MESEVSEEFMAVATVNVLTKLSVSLLNSNSLKISLVASISGMHILNCSSIKSTGTSSIMVASSLESIPNSLEASTFSFILPFRSAVFSSNFSMEPY